jgi:hypothetical protein
MAVAGVFSVRTGFSKSSISARIRVTRMRAPEQPMG